ncbi:SDR family oxidoreductase [Haladaptatus pallidirubidus]|uniref:Short chain dehydrogenase n=1 Tax=Haladaptatus pallidirubidus TaxID=1008152 RepID=A0AAV3UE00_9EURY|nr:SDR family NAD(P)-dependent oxidoreductase [Haladaptatus pallidirubidus]
MSSAENGQVVVITGANEGIGYHVATALLDRGYRVASLDVDGTNVQSLQETHPNRVQFYRCDVTVDGDVRTAVDEILDRWGRIDILVNNAAIFNFAPSKTTPLPTRSASSR